MRSDSLHQFQPVGLAMHGIGRYSVVHSVEEAAEALLKEWPDDSGDRFCEAVKACLDGIHDLLSPNEVRKAFICAAREARVMVIE